MTRSTKNVPTHLPTSTIYNPAQVPFSRIVYIDSSDFMENDQKDFFGLASGKSVMLR
jgi:hypothetical protein